MDLQSIVDLTDEDINTIIESLENYKSKGFVGEVMETLFEGIISKPESQMTEEEKQAKRQRDHEKELEREKKKKETETFKQDIDFLKTKLIFVREARKRERQDKLTN